MPVHVSSEIGRLRGVVVHSPGPELLAVTPSNRADYLYDDIIEAESAQREHRRFTAILERFTTVYEVRNLLVLGRVMTGEGGDVILAVANEVLKAEFPEVAERIRFHIPDEKEKRHGQAIAAASLPSISAQEKTHAVS